MKVDLTKTQPSKIHEMTRLKNKKIFNYDMSYNIHILKKKKNTCIINLLTWTYKFIVIVCIFLDILSIIWLYFVKYINIQFDYDLNS